MKNVLFTTTLLLLFTIVNHVEAQMAQNVTLRFLPYMGTTPMTLNETIATDINGVGYRLSRAQFYISGITLVHNGGQELIVPNSYLLINANQTDYSIGQQPINNLEAIRFHIGIDESTNHADPSVYPSGNPLALQNPSMHWGWAGGYRFVALEGQSADATSSFQYHCVGDEFYTIVEVPVSSISTANGIVANIYTNYANFMHELPLDVIAHGGEHQIEVLINNMQQIGFTADAPTAISNPNQMLAKVYTAPNPFSQQTTLYYQCPTAKNVTIAVYDPIGRMVYEQKSLSKNEGSVDISLPTANTYTYILYDQNRQIVGKGQMVSTQ